MMTGLNVEARSCTPIHRLTRELRKLGAAWGVCAIVLAFAATRIAQAQPTTLPLGDIASLIASDSVASERSDMAPLDAASAVRRFRSAADSMEWEVARRTAEGARGFRLVVSLFDRRLWAIRGDDTLRVVDAGVGMDSTLAWEEHLWEFETPRGQRTVIGKERDPVWIPPDWHYLEVAHRYGLRIERLRRDSPERLTGGRRLIVRGDRVALVDSSGTSRTLPAAEEIIFDGVLYVPPFATRNRRIAGELGAFKLDLGDGYLIHGTPDVESIGRPSTHGCIRLADEDIAWLYRNVPVGTRVHIY